MALADLRGLLNVLHHLGIQGFVADLTDLDLGLFHQLLQLQVWCKCLYPQFTSGLFNLNVVEVSFDLLYLLFHLHVEESNQPTVCFLDELDLSLHNSG